MGIISLFSLLTFLFASSVFAEYYIDALGYRFCNIWVIVDACIFIVVFLALLAAVIYLIVKVIKNTLDDSHDITLTLLLAIPIVSIFAFVAGFLMLFANGSNGCSYTEDINNYGQYEIRESAIAYFPEKITDEMNVVKYSYYHKSIGSSYYDIYLEVRFDDVEAMERCLEVARASFTDNGYVEYTNPYDPTYTEIVENESRIYSNEGDFISSIEFRGEEYKYVSMLYHSVSYSYDNMTVIYNFTQTTSEINVGNDPDAGKFYPRYLEKFGVEWNPEHDFRYEYRQEEAA